MSGLLNAADMASWLRGISILGDEDIAMQRRTVSFLESSSFPVPIETSAAMSGAQKNGSALTYGRRQSLVAVLGLTTADQDIDGITGETTETGELITPEQVADIYYLEPGHADHDMVRAILADELLCAIGRSRAESIAAKFTRLAARLKERGLAYHTAASAIREAIMLRGKDERKAGAA